MSFTYNPPTNLNFSAASSSSGTLSWTASTPIGGGGGGGSGSDPFFANVGLLLHMDNVGSSTFADSSANALTVTNSLVSQSATNPKFGPASGFFSSGTTPTGQLEISMALHGPIDLSTGDFTIEGWWYPTTLTGGPPYIPVFFIYDDSGGGAGADPIAVVLDQANQRLLSQSNLWGTAIPVGAIGSVPFNTWCHFALVMISGQAVAYVNGVATGSPITPSRSSLSGANLFVGGSHFGPSYGGYADEFRITKGVGRYTSNFTPPTAPFPDGGPAPGYHIYRGGVSLATVTGAGVVSYFDTVPSGGTYEYKVAAWDGVSADISDLSAPLDVLFGGPVQNVHVYGKFVGSPVFPPTLLIDAKGIKPRVYAPKENVTVKT